MSIEEAEWSGRIPVVVLADLSYSDQSLQILIGLVGVNVMERTAVLGVTVGCCEVYGDLRNTHTHTGSSSVPFDTSRLQNAPFVFKHKHKHTHAYALTVNCIWQPPMM